MATITLKIEDLTSSIQTNNELTLEMCSDAWEAKHMGETAIDQEKLDWVVDVLLRDAISNGADRLDRAKEREERRKQHIEERERREQNRTRKKKRLE